MKILLKIEEAFMFGLAIYLNSLLPYEGWLYWLCFLAPDLGFIGYTINTRIGAITYNTLHHKGLALGLYLLGSFYSAELLQFTGLILFGHSAFDRMLGYGLKFADSFHHTHLGTIGQNEKV